MGNDDRQGRYHVDCGRGSECNKIPPYTKELMVQCTEGMVPSRVRRGRGS